jgi:hypothetical protein
MRPGWAWSAGQGRNRKRSRPQAARWRNNHAYDERLRRIINRATAA